MPQILLPLFPAGVTEINDKLAFKNESGMVTYFNATMPVFQHAEDDLQSFKMIVSQFYVMGVAKQAEIVTAFGVNSLLVKRAVKIYREKGSHGFFAPKKSRGPGVLTETVLNEAQGLLNIGMTPRDLSQRLGLKVDTIRKAIMHGRLHRPSVSGNNGNGREASSKSERSAEDSDAGMG
jgi:hypothetical protein